MEEINFTEDELKEATKGNFVAAGSEASIYKNTKDTAIRIYDVDDGLYCPVTGKLVGRPETETLIKNLILYKDNIKLSDLPIGIVKLNDIVIGQIIRYYTNSISLTDFFKSSPSVDPIPYYLKVLDIIEELALNNIVYDDVHGGNFLIVGDELKIVDFSEYRVKTNENYRGLYYNMFQNFNTMVNKLNSSLSNSDDYGMLLIPSEIKNDTENLKENFDIVRELVVNLQNGIPPKRR